MPDFTVDIDGLKGLERNLIRCQDNIDEATKRLADLGPDSIGSDELDEACGEFRDDWENGLGELKEATDKITKGLGEAIKAYQEIEQGLSENLAKMQECIESVPVPAPGGGAVRAS